MNFSRAESPYAASVVVGISAFGIVRPPIEALEHLTMTECKLVPPKGSLVLVSMVRWDVTSM